MADAVATICADDGRWYPNPECCWNSGDLCVACTDSLWDEMEALRADRSALIDLLAVMGSYRDGYDAVDHGLLAMDDSLREQADRVRALLEADGHNGSTKDDRP